MKIPNTKFPACQSLALAGRQILRRGFSLIELLIVVAIFGLTVSLVTAAFITFDRNQKLRNAALQLKSDLRQAQNKALSGDKGSGGAICPSTSTLGGWYIQISTDSTDGKNGKYTLAGDCKTGAGDSSFAAKTIFLPGGVTVSAISLGAIADMDIFFQPLTSGVSFHNGSLVPPFFDSSGNLANQVGAGSQLLVTLTSADGSGTYQVVILPSGEINESKP
ncbi:MAG: prepilin-type N-terminal cleavage/methylation domain-containing protein [Candidatus Curtissbacteria bacterium]|nr:prepilin-type N-terminal cleavage/methylation domain-containing protein [Candidatus Curtissbacteria bacterium]